MVNSCSPYWASGTCNVLNCRKWQNYQVNFLLVLFLCRWQYLLRVQDLQRQNSNPAKNMHKQKIFRCWNTIFFPDLEVYPSPCITSMTKVKCCGWLGQFWIGGMLLSLVAPRPGSSKPDWVIARISKIVLHNFRASKLSRNNPGLFTQSKHRAVWFRNCLIFRNKWQEGFDMIRDYIGLWTTGPGSRVWPDVGMGMCHWHPQGLTKIKISVCALGNLHFSSTHLKLFWPSPKFSWQSLMIAMKILDQACLSGKWPMKLLAQQENLLAQDYRTRVLLSPASSPTVSHFHACLYVQHYVIKWC